MKQHHILLATILTASALSTTVAFSAEVIYEPFDYPAGIITNNLQNGGIGMSGAWTTATDDGRGPYRILSSALSFTNLPTTGKSCARDRYEGGGEMNRAISAASQSSLLADNTTIWFSVLVYGRPYSTGNEHQTVLLGTDAFTDYNSAPPAMAGGEGLGVGFNGQYVLKGVQIDGGTSSYSAGSLAVAGTTTYLIAGKIDWVPNGGNDTLRLFNVTDALGDTPTDDTAFATNTVDLDQSQFDLIAVAGKQWSTLDEIRYGQNYYSVMGREPPPPNGTVVFIR